MLQPKEPLPNSRRGDPRYPSTAHHRIIIDHVRRYGFERGAEIGLLKGKTYRKVLEACPDVFLIGVDQWRQLPESRAECAETYQRFDMPACEQMCRDIAAEFEGRAEIIKGESVRAARQVEDESLDFVFLDAGHTEDAVLADIEAWAPKVKPEGLIMGHDWWFPSVMRALDARLPGWERHEESVWTIAKADWLPAGDVEAEDEAESDFDSFGG
jgi:hypothetical protein